jgi:hypothetical protein
MQNEERVESGKAAKVAAAGGLLGTVPCALTSAASPLAAALTAGSVATCALCGIVYRYVVAADRDDAQLHSGAVAAFGLTRALPQIEAVLGAGRSDAEALAGAALLAGQSVLIVAFAAALLEARWRGAPSAGLAVMLWTTLACQWLRGLDSAARRRCRFQYLSVGCLWGV